MKTSIKSNTLLSIYLVGFLFAFHEALTNYINSNFLSGFVKSDLVGLIYTTGSLVTIVGFFAIPYFLKRFGNYRLSFLFLLLQALALLGLSFSHNSILIVLFFLVSFIAIPFFIFSLDIFLEGFSANRETGRIRGNYLSLTNLAWVFPPLISGLILSAQNYSRIYLASFFLLLPIFLIFKIGFKDFKDSEYRAVPVWSTIRELWQKKNILYIFWVDFLLQFFYSWMTIYTPIYLYQNMGFSWPVIGFIFMIMLIPFVFIQFPLGRLADRWWGEKEMLSIGFVIMAISTLVISFVTDHHIWLWAAILFMTRIGASVVEVMGDTYFFKKADGLNANIISLFRSARPLAYILGPLFATILLNVFSMPIKYTFLVLGMIMFLGLRFSLAIKDTK